MENLSPGTVRAASFLRPLALRTGRLAATLGVVALVVFVVLRVISGDPAQAIAGLHASAGTVEELRHHLGTDRPLLVQLGVWIGSLCVGDLGTSLVSGQPVADLLAARLPVTLTLAASSLVLALLLGIPLGVVAAVRRGSWEDHVILVGSQLGLAIPGFWLGILLLLGFAVAIPVFPLFGASTPLHFVLPTVALALGMAAILVRHTRSSLLEELGKDYVVGARAAGFSDRGIIWRQALPNALVPVISIAGIQFGYLLGGAVIVEQVFSLPGLGRLLLTAVIQRDLPVIQGGVLFLALAFSTANFAADLLQSLVSPRLRSR